MNCSLELISHAYDAAALISGLDADPRHFVKQSRARMLTICAIQYVCPRKATYALLSEGLNGAISQSNISSASARARRTVWWREDWLRQIVEAIGGEYTGPRESDKRPQRAKINDPNLYRSGVEQVKDIEPVFKAIIVPDTRIGVSRANPNMRIIDRRAPPAPMNLGEPTHGRSVLDKRLLAVPDDSVAETYWTAEHRKSPPITLAKLKWMSEPKPEEPIDAVQYVDLRDMLL